MKKLCIIIITVLYIQLVSCLIEPLSLGVATAVGIAAFNFYSSLSSGEKCTISWMPMNTEGLEANLSSLLHGQPIAAKTVLRAINGYVHTEEPPKALTMSFHGLPGSGKNFVANMIAESFFKLGINSQYYHFFNGRTFAPLESQLGTYKIALQNKIVESLRDCERSMFVFDEVDMMPVGLLNVLVPFMDYTKRTGILYKGDYVYVTTNKAVFIFLSNTGSRQIVEQMLKFWEEGKDRMEMKLADFENLITLGAFNEKGGFQKSDTIRTSLIDYYVPFMPLEEKHVRLCMRDAFRRRGEMTKSMVEEVLSAVTWGPDPHNIYAKSGCKKIEQKVISVMYQYTHGDF